MEDQHEFLIKDLRYRAHTLRREATHARSSTVKTKGQSGFADRCHTLAETHDEAAMVYEKMADVILANLQTSPNISGGA